MNTRTITHNPGSGTVRQWSAPAAPENTAHRSSIAPRREVRTLHRAGCEVYADTGRPVEERLGSHVVLWIVDDADAWASAIEAEGDAELDRWPKKDRRLAERRRSQRYEAATRIRAQGARRSWYSHFHSAADAEACAVDLRVAHCNPGVRYEVAAITGASSCPNCHQPMIQADGQWRHHLGNNSVECADRRDPAVDEAADADHAEGKWTIDVGMGTMTCG
ncbi:hypothetical protein [Nocardia amamiensis]|uniref:hypothetical protein n=1 Tax=Nocardia amamiensis TaxID=404578 RepID=UPI000A737625|nr:hypothetical protein [Nocardia amamiensis]